MYQWRTQQSKLSTYYMKITVLFACQQVQNFLYKMDSWKIFFTTPENSHMSLDASVILFAAVLSSTSPSLCIQQAFLHSPCKTCYPQTFLAWKMAHLVSFLLSVSFLFFLLDCCLSSNSKICLFFLRPLEGTKNLNFKEIKRPPLQLFLFLAEMDLLM